VISIGSLEPILHRLSIEKNKFVPLCGQTTVFRCTIAKTHTKNHKSHYLLPCGTRGSARRTRPFHFQDIGAPRSLHRLPRPHVIWESKRPSQTGSTRKPWSTHTETSTVVGIHNPHATLARLAELWIKPLPSRPHTVTPYPTAFANVPSTGHAIVSAWPDCYGALEPEPLLVILIRSSPPPLQIHNPPAPPSL